MKKSAAKAEPVNLGTKRSCPKCALKFYDFARPSIQCPKCGTEVDPNAELKAFKQPADSKKSKVKSSLRDDDEEATPVVSEEAFESVDDLNDDDEEGLEDLADDEKDDE